MLVGYWHKEGLEIYRLAEGKIVKFASGGPDTLKPVRAMGKKVLIVGRELLLHSRKKFPPASEADIKKAVELEIGDIFPLKSPGHSMNIFERNEAYTAVDIWAWDAAPIEALRKVFPFTHVLPEDSAFASDDPEISVLIGKEESCLLAHGRNGFLGKSIFRGSVDDSRIQMFLKGLGRYTGTIRRMNVYGGAVLPSPGGLPFPIVRKETKDYPPCIEYITRVDLRQFKVGAGQAAAAYADIVMRAVIYLLLAYGISLFITGNNYDAVSSEVKAKSSKLAASMTTASLAPRKEADIEVIGELKERLKAVPTPLGVMDFLAKHLPGHSSVIRMILNGNSLELALNSKEPLKVLEDLSGAEEVKSVKLKGAPSKDQKGIYTFSLAVELRQKGRQ